jgi:hypothetical protein
MTRTGEHFYTAKRLWSLGDSNPSGLFEIAFVRVLDHVASVIANANQSIM